MTDQPAQPDPSLQPPTEPTGPAESTAAAEAAAAAPAEPVAPPPAAESVAPAAVVAAAPVVAAAAAPPPPPAPPAAAPPAAAPPQSAWVQQTAAAPVAGWVQPPAVQAPRGRVTVLARFAGLLLLLIGVFWGVVGVLAIAGGQIVKDAINQNGLPGGDQVATLAAGVGIVFLFFAFWEILGGIGAIAGKGWGRAIGIIYSLIFGIASLVPLSGATRAASDTNTDLLPVLAFFGGHVIAYIFIFVVLAIRWRGKAPAVA